MTERITSAQNPKFRNLLLLQEKSRARREQGLFVVEGRRELQHCLEGGFRVKTLFVCPEVMNAVSEEVSLPWAEKRVNAPGRDTPSEGNFSIIEIPAELYRKAAYRESTEGLIAEVYTRERRLEDLQLGENPLVVVLESVEKPGNLGAVLRSADAAGADAVLVADPLTDLYNPNLIRASLGGVFTTQVATAPTEEMIPWLKTRGFRILTAQLQDSEWYYRTPMTGPTALVMGTESTGLSTAWREAADAHIRIPMLGKLDSLNVSVSAAILLYEAVRQRNAK